MSKNQILILLIILILAIVVVYIGIRLNKQRKTGEVEKGLNSQSQIDVVDKTVADELVIEQQKVNIDELEENEIMDLKIEILQEGAGLQIKPGQTAVVHYTGWLENGTKFDSSVDRSEPFAFQLGAGMVIAGWDQGVAGMQVGEKRRLVIPASLGYGESGVPGVIPANATLIFEVELLDIK